MGALSERIKQVRTTAQMTQQEFAQTLGTHQNTIGRWERGQAEPDINSVSLLCSKLGVSPYWLLAGDGPMLDKDREIKLHAGPGTKGSDLRGLKFSEVSGGLEADITGARFQAKWKEIAQALPEGREDADMEKAFLYYQIKQLEAALKEAKEAASKAKDEALAAYKLAVRAMRPATDVPQFGVPEDDTLARIKPTEDDPGSID